MSAFTWWYRDGVRSTVGDNFSIFLIRMC